MTRVGSPARGRQRRLRVAAAASALAANPFESALRALAIEAGLQVVDLLRFSWEQVILHPGYARALMERYARTGVGRWNGPESTYPGSNASPAA